MNFDSSFVHQQQPKSKPNLVMFFFFVIVSFYLFIFILFFYFNQKGYRYDGKGVLINQLYAEIECLHQELALSEERRVLEAAASERRVEFCRQWCKEELQRLFANVAVASDPVAFGSYVHSKPRQRLASDRLVNELSRLNDKIDGIELSIQETVTNQRFRDPQVLKVSLQTYIFIFFFLSVEKQHEILLILN